MWVEKKRTHKIAQECIATRQSSSSSCWALFRFRPFFFFDFIAAGCLNFFFNSTSQALSNSTRFFFIATKTYKLIFCSLVSLVLSVTQKKKIARDQPVNSYLFCC